MVKSHGQMGKFSSKLQVDPARLGVGVKGLQLETKIDN